MWPHILERRPDLWIWGGDNIYADERLGFRLFPRPRLVFRGANESYLSEVYAAQVAVPGYKALVESGIPVIGTWDDHDYGLNDGDRTYDGKHFSQRQFLDFLGEAPDSPRRSQEGVYEARRFDFGEGASVLVVNLDMRYHRDPYGTPGGDFLGQAQWEWLEQVLAESTARAHIIVSSLQFLEPRQALGENWGRFPGARSRLLGLLSKVRAPIVISGDVHFAELSVARCTSGRLLEVTSSGMTHSWGTRLATDAGILINHGMAHAMRLAQRLLPWRYQMHDPKSGEPQHYLGLNFGELEFDWLHQTLSVTIFGVGGHPQLSQRFTLAELDQHGDGADVQCIPERGQPGSWRAAVGIVALAGLVLLPVGAPTAFLIFLTWRMAQIGSGPAPDPPEVRARRPHLD